MRLIQRDRTEREGGAEENIEILLAHWYRGLTAEARRSRGRIFQTIGRKNLQQSIERHKRKKASRRVEEWLTVRNKELRGCKREEEEERREECLISEG